MSICQIYNLENDTLWLGRQDEGGTRQIAIDASPWIDELGSNGTLVIVASRPGEDDSPYNPAVSVEGSLVVWTPSEVDTAKDGRGYAELRYYVDAGKLKSKAFRTIIDKAPYMASDPPSAVEPFVERVEAAAMTAAEAASTATAKASEATQAATTATASAQTSTAKAGEATTAAAGAKASETAAKTSETNAAQAETVASQAASTATSAAVDAATARTAAVNANTSAQAAKTAAENARTGAESARDEAQSIADSMVLKATSDGNGNVTLTV